MIEPGLVWYLEGAPDASGRSWRFPLKTFPFRVGRDSTFELRLASPKVSKNHAQLYMATDGVHLRDLGSRNGTFVNRQRLSEDVVLQQGDVVHFADVEFRVITEQRLDAWTTTMALDLSAENLPATFEGDPKELYALIEARAMELALQPIVDLRTGQTMGVEALCRGRWPGLPESPKDLFQIAAEAGLELELSRLSRQLISGIQHRLSPQMQVFLNTHPRELAEPGSLAASLEQFRREVPSLPVVLEIHEAAVSAPETMGELRRILVDLEIGLAYDDFGAGQARLIELIQVPPDFLKFDMSLIRGIDAASSAHRSALGTLTRMVRDLGVATIAEGIETETEAAICIELEMDYGQGYLYGRPSSNLPNPT